MTPAELARLGTVAFALGLAFMVYSVRVYLRAAARERQAEIRSAERTAAAERRAAEQIRAVESRAAEEIDDLRGQVAELGARLQQSERTVAMLAKHVGVNIAADTLTMHDATGRDKSNG